MWFGRCAHVYGAHSSTSKKTSRVLLSDARRQAFLSLKQLETAVWMNTSATLDLAGEGRAAGLTAVTTVVFRTMSSMLPYRLRFIPDALVEIHPPVEGGGWPRQRQWEVNRGRCKVETVGGLWKIKERPWKGSDMSHRGSRTRRSQARGPAAH